MWAVLACATIIGGVLGLALPFDGDQALFAVGARHIANGGVLYADFWDLKQPAVFWFFAAAGALFGRGPVAVHFLEAIWYAFLAVALALAAKRWFASRWAWPVVPLLAVTYAQLIATPDAATQVEALAPLPLFLALWAFVEALSARKRAWLLFCAAGAAAGAAMLFKQMFVIVVLAMWACALAAARPAANRLVRAAAAVLAGVAVPLVAAVTYFALHGALREALVTWFVIPGQIVREIPHQSVRVFMQGVHAYLLKDAPLVVLAGISVMRLRRTAEPLAAGALGWIAGGVVTIALQVTSWWSYQWQLLAVPTAWLAAAGIELLLARAPGRRNVLAATLALVIAAYPLMRAHAKLAVIAREGFGEAAAQRDAIQLALSPTLRRARDVARTMPVRGDRELYVFGDPTPYEVLGTRQPVAINGWLPELLTARLRTELLAELDAARPRLIFIDESNRADFERFIGRSPEFARFFATAYEPRPNAYGRLYEVRASRREAPRRAGTFSAEAVLR